MPAGDAGLERQPRIHSSGGGCPSTWNPAYVCPDWHFEPTPGEHEASCVCCRAANALLHGLDIEYAATVNRLQAQLAAQQAVVDAARDYRQSVVDMMHVMETGGDAWRRVRERRVNAESRMFSALAALDTAQAAQPEGEPR